MDHSGEGGTGEVAMARVQALPRLQPTGQATGRIVQPYTLLPRGQLKTLQPPEWLIQDLIQAATSIILCGMPGVGKTFIALAFALSIATGVSFHGRPVRRRGPVVYLTPEGVTGLNLRVTAWEQAHGASVSDDNFIVLPDAPQLHHVADLDRLIHTLGFLKVKPELLVIDTLARHFVGGDENNAKDMGMLVAAGEQLRKRFDCSSMFVHHTTKGRDDLRGSSALAGSAETIILAKTKAPKEQRLVDLVCEKQKESEAFKMIELQLGQVTVPTSDGGTRTSCVLLKAAQQSRLSPDALKHQLVGEPLTVSKKAEHQEAILRAFWSEAGFASTELSRGQIEKASAVPTGSFARAAEELIARQLLERSARGLYKLTTDGQNAVNSMKPDATDQ